MKEKKLVPKRRFKEFQNIAAWEQRKLGEVTDIFDGTHQTPKYTKSGVKFVSVENISNLETKKYISKEAYDKEYSKKQAEKGDVLMTRIGDIGTSKVIETDQPLAYYVTLALLKPKDVDSEFLSWAIASPEVQRDIWKRTLHIAFPKKINLGEINQVKLMLPKVTEQKAIGQFFKSLNNLITLHQRKLEKTKALKSAYLAELFPTEGERVPKRRFAGFTGEWKEDKLGNITDVRDGTHDSPKYHSEGHPFITSKNVKNGMISYEDIQYISDIDFEKINKRSKVDQNDILMGMIGTIGNMALIKKKPDFAIKNVALIKDIKKINYLYLYHYLESPIIIKQLSEDMDGGTQKFISLNKIRNLIIEVPELDEQIRVSEFFRKLDDSITNQQQKLDKLKAMKQAYLQEMFV